jgi:tetratricopeptide (TPR) repeat protein
MSHILKSPTQPAVPATEPQLSARWKQLCEPVVRLEDCVNASELLERTLPCKGTESHLFYVAGVLAHARLQSDAIPLLFQSHRADPANLRTALVLSELLRGIGDEREAQHADNVVSSLLPTASTDEVDFAEAVRAPRVCDAKSAAQSLARYVRRNPSETFVWTVTARHFGGGGVIAGRRRFLNLCKSVISDEPSDIVAARRAFSLHETGRFKEAEGLASQALSVNPRNGSAKHSLFHVLYETGRHSDGLALAVDWLSGEGAHSPMRSHFGWHAAIHAMALGDCDEARRILRTAIIEPPNLRGMAVDGPVLIWLLHLRGDPLPVELGSFKQALNALHFSILTPLAAACVAFGLAAFRERQRLCKLADESQAHSDERFVVAKWVARGLVSWLDEDWVAAEKSLRTAKQHRWRLGGSHIQQEAVESTWRVSADRCGVGRQ